MDRPPKSGFHRRSGHSPVRLLFHPGRASGKGAHRSGPVSGRFNDGCPGVANVHGALEESIEEGQPLRTGNISRNGPTGVYTTKDGDVSITVASDDQWGRLSRALDAPELLEDPRFDSYVSRTVNVTEARQHIQCIIGKFTLEEAVELLERHDVPSAPVRTAEQVMNDRHFWTGAACCPCATPGCLSRSKAWFPGSRCCFPAAQLPEMPGAPTLGMHNREIFSKFLGLGEADLAELKELGVV